MTLQEGIGGAGAEVFGQSPKDAVAVKYRTIVADPPWPVKYEGGGTRRGGSHKRKFTYAPRGIGYETMTVDAIAALPVSDLADENAALFLWIPDAFLIRGVGDTVVRAWGFEPGRLLIWEKPNFGMGTFPRPTHEAMIVAKRGSVPWAVNNARSVQRWTQPYEKPRFGEGGKKHSGKPDGALDLIEQASPGPYLELFSRRARLGWDTHGDESLGHVELVG